MSAAAVRSAIANYIAPVQGITHAYRAFPPWTTPDEWDTGNGTPGTVTYVHIAQQNETQIALTGSPMTGKRVDYQIELALLYRYQIPDGETAKDNWVDGLDQLIEAIKQRLRADSTLGTGPGGVVWQAGINAGDLEVVCDLPKTHNGSVLAWNVFKFSVVEML